MAISSGRLPEPSLKWRIWLGCVLWASVGCCLSSDYCTFHKVCTWLPRPQCLAHGRHLTSPFYAMHGKFSFSLFIESWHCSLPRPPAPPSCSGDSVLLSRPFGSFRTTAAGSLCPQYPLPPLWRWTNLIPCQILVPRVCNSVLICWIEANWYHNSVLRRFISQGSWELNQRASSKVSFLLNCKSKLGWDMSLEWANLK